MTTATLREHEAWLVALAWREELRGRVRLEVDLNACETDTARVAPSTLSIVDRFEWVTFVFNGFRHEGFRAVGNIRDVASAARAATIAWYAITCCPGFGGAENPDFWRRVFSELTAPEDACYATATRRAQVPITPAVRFFDAPERPFPRVRVVPKSGDAEQCVRLFLRDGKTRRDRHSLALDRLLAMLGPFMLPSRWSRVISVALDEVPASTITKFLPSLQLRCTPPCTQAFPCPPAFRLETVFLQGDDLASLVSLQQVAVYSHAHMIVRRCDVSDLSALLRAPEATQCILRRRLTVHTVDLIRPHESAAHFAALCAALPSVSWITACRVFSFGVFQPKDPVYRSNMAWLGYALFHPDVASPSGARVSLQALEIASYRFPFDLTRILKTMATGNNLLPVLTGDGKPSATAPLAKGYYSGRVAASTVARAKPSRLSHSVYTFVADQWVTICTTTASTSLMESWVAVVVPGIGLAWIRKAAIRAVATRGCTTAPCVRRLRLSISEDPHASLPSLLTMLGSRLESLDVAETSPRAIPAEPILLQRCPRLKSLRIASTPEVWAEPRRPELTELLPLLEELELHVPGVDMDMLRSLRLANLKTLRVAVPAANVFQQCRDQFLSTLIRCPTIQYAHWHVPQLIRRATSISSAMETSRYEDYKRNSRDRLGDLTVWKTKSSNTILDGGPEKLGLRGAFLSVVHQDTGVVGRLGMDVVAIILGFLPHRHAREIYISNGDEL